MVFSEKIIRLYNTNRSIVIIFFKWLYSLRNCMLIFSYFVSEKAADPSTDIVSFQAPDEG